MATRSAMLRLGLLLACSCLALAGCKFLEPAYVDLYQTAWTVTSLDGSSLDGKTSMSFNENAQNGVVTVRTPCGLIQILFDTDTVGDGIKFWTLAPRPTTCSAAERLADGAFFDALEDVESLQIDDEDHIRFVGSNEIDAARMPAGSGTTPA
jgi:hypothetical protein